MEKLKVRTKGNAQPQGKPKVFFTCHPNDFGDTFDLICEQLFKASDCAVYYTEDVNVFFTQEEYDLDLNKMNLFVIPVTLDLLTTENRAMTFDFVYARSVHIPVLPIMMGSGLDQVYGKKDKFGELQYLDPKQDDGTGVSFEDKLRLFLRSVLTDDEMAEKIRSAFDAYVFLSYRKKDRRFADELMRLIHSDPSCRDIAIWYDEYLIPGEGFREAIEKAMEKSDLFALLVTPNLVNEENYVHTVEYPAAKDLKKKIVAAEMEPTDKEKLYRQYDGLKECFDARDEDSFRKGVIDAIREVALKNNDDPLHNYLIGLAYLDGIDVETDRKRALELIKSSADAGLSEAMKKLCYMYRDGSGVELNYEEALKWALKAKDAYKEEYGEEDKDTVAIYEIAANLLELTGRYKESLTLCEDICVLKEKVYGRDDLETRYSYERLAVVYRRLGDSEKAAGILEKICEEELKTGVLSRQILSFMSSLASCYADLGYWEGALELQTKALELCREKYGEEDPDTLRNINDLAVIYHGLGDYEKAIEISKEALDKTIAIYGEKHPNAITALDNLGVLYEKNGMFEEGQNAHADALELSREVMGEKHPDTIRCIKNLAMSEMYLGDYNSAVNHMTDAYGYYLDLRGPSNVTTLSALGSLAHICSSAGEHELAADIGRKAYEANLMALGDKHPNTVLCYINLGMYLGMTGEYEESLRIGKEAFLQAREVFGELHPHALSALICLSEACFNSKKGGEALDLAYGAYKEFLGSPLNKYDAMSEIETNLARSYMALSENEKELEIRKDKLKRLYEVRGDKNLETAHAASDLANALYRMGLFEEAEPEFEEAHRLFAGILGEGVQGTQNVMCNRAKNYLAMK